MEWSGSRLPAPIVGKDTHLGKDRDDEKSQLPR
jgi:hypothetical protein